MRLRATNAGAVDFVYMPIDPTILRSKADIYFELFRQRLQLAYELQERTHTLRLNEMFTAILGHDLRNPLNAIMTSALALQRTSMGSESSRRPPACSTATNAWAG